MKDLDLRQVPSDYEQTVKRDSMRPNYSSFRLVVLLIGEGWLELLVLRGDLINFGPEKQADVSGT